MPRPRPASNRDWCEQWDISTNQLIEELSKPDCDVDRVVEIIAVRRRLTTASPISSTGSALVSEEEQHRWLVRALDREQRVSSLALEVKDRLGRSLVSLQSGRQVRRRFNEVEALPRVFSTQV